MKKLFILLLFTLIYPSTTFADTFLGIHMGAGAWNTNYEGKVKLHGPEIDLQEQFELDSSANGFFYLAFEHFVPFVPNAKVQYTSINSTGDSVLDASILFSTTVFSSGEDITSSIDLNNADLILYYEFLDNWVSFDIGVNIKVFDGKIVIKSATSSVTHEFTSPIPMLYSKIKFDLPFTGFYLGGEGSGAGTGGSQVLDLKAFAGYESESGLGGEIGWRKISLNVDDADDMMADISIDGVFASVTFHF